MNKTKSVVIEKDGLRFTKIPSVDKMKEVLADGDMHDFVLLFNGGLFSRKTIWLIGKKFHIENHIDNSHQRLTEKEIINGRETNIGEAIIRGAFWLEEVV